MTDANQLQLDVSRTDEECVVEVIGELDIATSFQLRARVIELIEAGDREIVLDLSQLRFLDSTGLGVLVGAHKRVAAEGGSLALRSPTSATLRVLLLMGLDRVFDITV